MTTTGPRATNVPNHSNTFDFEADAVGNALSAGQFIDDEFADFGISVFGARPGESLDGTGTNRAMIFDTANPTGGDTDLATDNQGNVLIITEDDDQSDPDDNIGGTFVITFDSPRSLESLGFIDTEEVGGTIRAYDANNVLIQSVSIPSIPNGAQQVVEFETDGVTRLEVTLAGSGAISHLSFGDAGLGDVVFFDENRNGIQDIGELGLAGVTVTLIGGGADGVIGNDDDTIETTTTDSNGFYEFQGLNIREEYQVLFSDLPAGFKFTTPNAGGDTVDSDAAVDTGLTPIVTLNPGEFNDTIDAGLVAIPPASLGDTVFLDADRDGMQDPGEMGVEGVTVTITGAGDDGVFGTGDDTEGVTITDVNGNYNFGNLAPGDYKVTFSDLPSGFEFTTPNASGDDTTDSDADPTTGMSNVITLGEGETNNDVDAGLVEPILPARLGNQVFDDLNQNGIRDAGEPGVQGVKVSLIGGGEDGLLCTLGDNTENSVVTNQRGRYSFKNLAPGEYQVIFSELPDGFEFTTQDQGSNDGKDSDADSLTGMTEVIVLESGEINNTIDAGIFLALPTPEKNFIRGTIAPDFLSGTAGADDIRGLGDSDTLLGFGGDDCLFGNGGFDLIRAGAGADTVFGGEEDDTLFGNGGNDILSGGTGSDSLVGGGGADTLDGTQGADDTSNGANETDTLIGGASGDLFVLGNTTDKYYLAAGEADFAAIQGFNASQDSIQLNGSVGDYSTTVNGNDLELRTSGELIAIFEGTDSLDLNAVAVFV